MLWLWLVAGLLVALSVVYLADRRARSRGRPVRGSIDIGQSVSEVVKVVGAARCGRFRYPSVDPRPDRRLND
jgi:hypothetical protein